MTQELVLKIKNLVKKLSINFQSTDKNEFLRITGADTFNKVRNNIALLRDANIEVTLNVVNIDFNQDKIVNIISYAIQQGCNVKVLEVLNTFYAKRGDELFLRFAESV